MPNITAINSISPAFRHARSQLFGPFRWGVWARLALLGLATGELSSGGGFNFPTSFPSTSRPQSQHFDASAMAAWPHYLLSSVLLLTVLIVSAVVLLLLFIFVASVCRFILFDTVLTRRCALREGWRRWQTQGWRYFAWQLLLSLVMFAGLALIIAPPVLYAISQHLWTNRSEHLLLIVLGITAMVTLVLAWMVTSIIINVFTKDFVVPQMALEDVSAFEGWRRLLRMANQERGRFAGYIGMKIVLNIGSSVVVGIGSMVVVLILMVPLVIVALLIIFAGSAAGLTWNAFTITLAVVVGILAFAGLMFAVAFVAAPVTVFFPAYSMYFFADRYPPLRARLYPEVPASSNPPPQPSLPPPEAFSA